MVTASATATTSERMNRAFSKPEASRAAVTRQRSRRSGRPRPGTAVTSVACRVSSRGMHFDVPTKERRR
jgi:hypothetical protein